MAEAMLVEKMANRLQVPVRNRRLDCPLCAMEGATAGHNSMSIMPGGYGFKCFRCGTTGNAIHFLGLFKYNYTRDYIDNNPEVKRKLTNEVYGGNSSLQANSQLAFRPVEFKRVDVDPADIEERDQTYNALLSKLQLSDIHRQDLLRRGLRESDIDKNGYASTPKFGFTKIPSDLRKEACDLLGVPGFYKKNDIWCLAKTKPGFFIPARDILQLNNDNANGLGKIQGMQIRFDTVAPNDTRYKWLSTRDMDSGCAAETYVHFAGYPLNTCILTEGPLKADIIYRFLEIPTIAVPGVNSLKNLEKKLNQLWKIGVRRIRTAFDMDYITNVNVQESYVKLVKMLQEYGYVVERLKWDENYKGLDDWLLNVHKNKNGK